MENLAIEGIKLLYGVVADKEANERLEDCRQQTFAGEELEGHHPQAIRVVNNLFAVVEEAGRANKEGWLCVKSHLPKSEMSRRVLLGYLHRNEWRWTLEETAVFNVGQIECTLYTDGVLHFKRLVV
ncbi:MAG: hypothetical protein OXT68_06800 [Chloroflexota bacterium]|nr:hypothetical protein [Chloroflexota bacterium]